MSYNADYAQNGVPVGTLIDYAGQTAPAGYLVCDGSLVSRTTYADLFKAIGTLYGTGDGSTTFGLPNLIDKFKQGASSAGTYKEAGLPNIKGSLQGDVFGAGISLNFTNLTGAFSASNGNLYSLTGNGQIGNTNNAFLQLDASKYSSVYSDTVTTVQPPALTVLPCIKY